MNTARLNFDDDFYRLGAIILSDKFASLEKQVLKRFTEIGHPIPLEGFSNYKDYQKWLKEIMNKVDKSDYPGTVIENVLIKFNVNPKNEKYRKGVAAKIFFGKQFGERFGPLQEPIYLVNRDNNEQKELWIRIYPWTKKPEYEELWKTIKNVQSKLPSYRGKEKFQTTFARDFKTYQFSLKVLANSTIKNKPLLDIMASDPEYFELSKRFKNENIDDHMRSIKSRFDKLLNKISIL